MLKQFRVDNFKSLINISFEPGPVNILIGENNSGKTNLCQALRFLARATLMPLAEAALAITGEPWNLTNAYLDKDAVAFAAECELKVAGHHVQYAYELRFRVANAPHLGPYGREFFVDLETLRATGGPFHETVPLLVNTGGNVKLLHEGKYAESSDDPYEETTAPTNGTMLSRLYDLRNNSHADQFKKYLAGWLYYELAPNSIRGSRFGSTGPILLEDGSNLAHVLFLLKSIDEQSYRRFVTIVKEVEPKLEALNFVPPTQDFVHMSVTDSENKRFGMPAISNGTLLFMALTYVIALADFVPTTFGLASPLVTIEEPENGLHVGHLKRLMELAEPIETSDVQFIFTTHSPYFVDLFDKHLSGVHVLKSDGTHSEIVKRDPARIEKVLRELTLGEAHYQRLLE